MTVAAALTISYESRGSNYSLVLTSHHRRKTTALRPDAQLASPYPIDGVASPSDIGCARGTLEAFVDEFKEKARRARVERTPALLHAALRYAHDYGLSWQSSVLGLRAADGKKMRRFMRQSLSRWYAAGRSTPIIEFRAPLDAMFPIELWPLTDEYEWDTNTRGSNYPPAFLGFAGAVRRVPAGWRHPANHLLRNVPRLPVKVLFNAAELRRTCDEADIFRKESIDREGPWPSDETQSSDLRLEAAKALADPHRRFDGGVRDYPDQVVHLACHCTVDSKQPDYSLLSFASPSGSVATDVDIMYLSTVFQKNTARRDPDTSPLIFLNACESSCMGTNSTMSFPRHFLAVTSRSVIGTEGPIPDETALQLAERFYRKLMNETPAAVALTLARVELVQVVHDPLGLIYALYGDPEVTVERKMT